MKTKLLFVAIWILFIFSYSAWGQSYQSLGSFTSSGGTKANSSGYQMWNSVGGSAGGEDSSSGYEHGSGLWQQFQQLQEFLPSSYSVADGWNMVSVPQKVADYRKNVLYPTSSSAAFIYVGAYRARDTLQNGVGYWLKFDGDQHVPIAGVRRTTDTVIVSDKWNMVGSIGNPLPTSAIISDPTGIVTSPYFGYDNGYFASDTILPGEAYWVKTNGGGKLIFSSSLAMSTGTLSATDELAEMNVISVEEVSTLPNVKHRPKKLYFGRGIGKSQSGHFYEMPPSPPKGGVDVRFSSNSFVEMIGQTIDEPQEIPLLIQSSGKSLKLSWEMKEQSEVKYLLVERSEGKVSSQHRLRGSGSLVINPNEMINYILRVEQIPHEFALYQNYPNPFNPTTTIRFDLPEPAVVTLKVFNILGQEVSVPLNNQGMEEGQHSVMVEVKDMASGGYFYRMVAEGIGKGKVFQNVMKMIVVR